MSVTDPKEVEVANLASETDLSFLNEDPGEYDVPPEVPSEPVAVEPTEPTPPPVETPAVTPSIPSHPQSLINAAIAVGVDERYLAPGVVDTQALADWVIEKRMHAAEAAAMKAAAPKAEPVDEDDDALLTYAEKELQVDPKLTTLLRRQNKQLKELKERDADREKQFADMQANSAKRHAAAINNAIDDAVEKLGPKFEAVLGKGPIGTLQDKDAIEVRSTIYMAARIDQNDSPSAAAKKYEAAAKKIYKMLDVAPAPAPAPKNGKPMVTEDTWANSGLSRPTSSLPKGKKAALDYIRDHMRENGQVQSVRDDDFDGIPD